MSLNANLRDAKRNKNDEFYTQLSDIENELKHYREHFRDKVIYCNCDDPRVSNFVRYFAMNFAHLGLRRLTATCYQNQDADLFSRHDKEQAIKLQYTGHRPGERDFRPQDIAATPLDGDGDFRSAECIKLLRESDIVVTNPPFSLFREYVGQLVEHGKNFLIIGSKNAITYKEIFPLIRDGKLWVGVRPMSGGMLFDVSNEHANQLVAERKENSAWKRVEGKVKGWTASTWFTNLDHAKRHEELPLWRTYSPVDYPHYDNYDAINVDKVIDIPVDWDGAMGVPITFLDKYNPDQFNIVGITDRDNNSGLKTKEYTSADVANPGDLNRRGVIKVGGQLKSTYVRLLVKRKPPQ